jgi:tRNA(Ile)-lysidine synthase
VQVNLVADSFVNRFKDALNKLSVAEDARILLAVSGGPDSFALLLLAKAALPSQIVAATVDHRLRPESAAEADYVAAFCAAHLIPHQILRPDEPITGNIQSAARVARYALLEQAADTADCSVIATAHHADDQLETLLMRLARGSGVDGMSGIRQRNGRIVRPLLEFYKSELEEICKSAEIKPVRDPSNDNNNFDRVAMRQWLARGPHPIDPARTNRTAAALSDAGIALAWMAEQLAVSRIAQIDTFIQCDARSIPYEMQRRLVVASLAMLAPELQVRGEALDRLIDSLCQGHTTTIGNVLCKGGDVWEFSPAPTRRSV